MSGALPFALASWVKRDQEERRLHVEKMATKYYAEDKHEYMKLVRELCEEWSSLKIREKQFLLSLATQHTEKQRVFSVGQRSALMSMYMKYCLNQ